MMKLRPVILFATALASACATGPAPKAPAAIAEVPPRIASAPYYLSPEAMTSFRPGAPAPLGSPRDRADLEAMKAAQSSRTRADCDRAAAEAEGPHTTPFTPSYPESFGDIGPFAMPLGPAARAFVIKVWSDSSLVSEGIKSKFRWPRAFAVDRAIRPCIPNHPESPAFPSGHTLVSRVFAHVLSELDPARRELYFERADRIARDRVIGGVHRPSELEAGKALGDQIFERLMESESFRSDLAKARSLVRRPPGRAE